MNYHTKLQTFFKSKGISQKKIADEMGLSRSNISRYFNKAAPNYEFIKSINLITPDIDWNHILKDNVEITKEGKESNLKTPDILLKEIKVRVNQLEDWHKSDTKKS